VAVPVPATSIVRHALLTLRERMYLRATFVVAPAGFGKSTLLHEAAADGPAVFVAVGESATFARFTSDLIEGAAKLLPGLDRSFAGAFSRALQTGDAPRALALWFTRQLAHTSCRIIVDGLDRANGSLVGAFLQHAIEASPESVSWLVATRHLETLNANSLLAFGFAALPLDAGDLRLRGTELRALNAREARIVGAKAAGSISKAFFLLRAHAHGVPRILDPAMPFERIVEGLFAGLTVEEQRAALARTLVPTSSVGLAPDPAIERLREDAPHLFEPSGPALQACFEEWMRHKFDELTPESRDALCLAVATELEAIGDVRGALSLLARVADERPAIRSIERHAASALEREHLHFLHDAVAHLSEETRRGHPIVLAFLAMEASLGNQVDLAESLFQSAMQAAQTSGSLDQAQCVRYWYACELVRRDRSDAIALLRPNVEFFKTRPRLRVAMMSTLAVAYAGGGRLDRGKRWIERALRSVARVDDDGLRAYVHHHASYIALSAEDGPEARRLAECALRFADAAGTAQIATAASSVLYAVAMDLEDDLPGAAAALQQLSTYAARAGNVSGQLYALAALFELDTDRGNVTALGAIERELAEFDLQYGAAVESETIVPAQAIQHAWHGDFERAYRILVGSDEQQFSDDRRALRLAEIAVYAAAAGFEREAHDAANKALGYLRPGERELRTLRAGGFAALALVLVGRTAEARPVLRELRLAAVPGSRSALFGDIVGALADRRDGQRVSATLAMELERLRTLEWTGIARVVETLPSHLLTMGDASARNHLEMDVS
jgi:ATP/maltotriose-dependent transcriptional regulator MalT